MILLNDYREADEKNGDDADFDKNKVTDGDEKARTEAGHNQLEREESATDEIA